MRKKWGIAAIFAIIAVIGCALYSKGLKNDSCYIAALENGDTIQFTKSDSGAFTEQLVGLYLREMNTEEIYACFGELPVAANAVYAEADGQFIGIDGRIGNVKIAISASGSDFQLRDTEIAGQENDNEIQGVKVTAGYFLTKPNSDGIRTAIFYVSFMLDEYIVYLENAGKEHEIDAVCKELTAVMQRLIDSGQVDFSKIHK